MTTLLVALIIIGVSVRHFVNRRMSLFKATVINETGRNIFSIDLVWAEGNAPWTGRCPLHGLRPGQAKSEYLGQPSTYSVWIDYALAQQHYSVHVPGKIGPDSLGIRIILLPEGQLSFEEYDTWR